MFKHNDIEKRKCQLCKYSFTKCNIKGKLQTFSMNIHYNLRLYLFKALKIILYFDVFCSSGNYC